jgi:hypothetical protein
MKPVHRRTSNHQNQTLKSHILGSNAGWDEMSSNGIASEPPQSALAFNAPLEGATDGKEIGPIIFPVLCRLYLVCGRQEIWERLTHSFSNPFASGMNESNSSSEISILGSQYFTV